MYLFAMWRKQNALHGEGGSSNKRLPPNFNTIIDLTIDTVHLVLGSENIDTLQALIQRFDSEIKSLGVPTFIAEP